MIIYNLPKEDGIYTSKPATFNQSCDFYNNNLFVTNTALWRIVVNCSQNYTVNTYHSYTGFVFSKVVGGNVPNDSIDIMKYFTPMSGAIYRCNCYLRNCYGCTYISHNWYPFCNLLKYDSLSNFDIELCMVSTGSICYGFCYCIPSLNVVNVTYGGQIINNYCACLYYSSQNYCYCILDDGLNKCFKLNLCKDGATCKVYINDVLVNSSGILSTAISISGISECNVCVGALVYYYPKTIKINSGNVKYLKMYKD